MLRLVDPLCQLIVCMVITYSKGKDQPNKVQSCSWSAEEGKLFFPVPVRA